MINNKRFYVVCSYIPPGSLAAVYEDHKKAIDFILLKLKPSDWIMFAGDFNMPSISWENVPDLNYLIPSRSSIAASEFIDGLSNNCLFQINPVTNSNGKILDLVLVNEPTEFYVTRHVPVSNPEDRHHPTIEINCDCSFLRVSKKITKKNFCFYKTNYIHLHRLLSRINWVDELSRYDDDFDSCLNTFYSLINDCFTKSVPKTMPIKSTGPPWNTRYLIRLKNKKNKMFKNYKKYGTSIAYMKYTLSRSKFNIANQCAYNNYLCKVRNNLKKDPKSFYNFVNSKRRSTDFPQIMKFGNIESAEDITISNLFADFFASTYSSSKYINTNQYPYPIPESSVNFSPITDTTVLNYLLKLKMSYVAGPDGVPSCILKKCSHLLHTPLTYLFNKSIKLCYFPTFWKESFIIPLFKSGSKKDVSNYRGIAKLSAIPKLFEQILYDTLSHQTSSILSSKQHGFRKSCSTVTNLLELTTIVNDGFINRKQTDVIYTDFSKAFDKVNHNLLLFKLDNMGFSNSLVKWISTYLKGRTQCVKFRSSFSNKINVTSGVPQGSHLGPLLFILFINDLPTAIQHSNSLMYADDVKLFLSFNNPYDQHLLQNDINRFSKWCKINLMDLNIKKCKYMIFTRLLPFNGNYMINNTALELVEYFNDLGIYLDKHLDFKAHISLTINKASGVLGFIKRWSKEFSDPYTTKQLYTTLVRPILEYGSVIWDLNTKFTQILLSRFKNSFCSSVFEV